MRSTHPMGSLGLLFRCMTAKDSERPWGIFQRGEAAPRAWTTYFSGVDRLFSGVDHRHFRGVDQLSLSRTLALSLLLSRSFTLSLSIFTF